MANITYFKKLYQKLRDNESAFKKKRSIIWIIFDEGTETHLGTFLWRYVKDAVHATKVEHT